MSSNSGNADFWTKIQGICTIIGLGIGSLLTLVTLYLAILSYRQMNSIKQHIVAPTFGEPPPPYADPSAEKPKSKKHLFGVIAIPAALTGGGSSSDDEMARGNIRREVRRGRLGNRRWFIALLIVMIILACGVIAVAANISNIQKLSNSRSLSQAAVVPNSNPDLPTLPLTQATTATDRQTATSVALGKNIYSTTYIHGTAFIVFPGPTSIAVGDVPAGVTGITTTASGTPYVVITGSTNIPISTKASLSTTVTSTDSMASPTADPSATESEVSNPSSTGTPSTYSYEGCISDNENRTLSGLHTTSASMTTEKCAKYCSGSAYFGTEYGSQCWCGNEIWQYAGISPTETNCNATCTGNQDEICGATWWMSLYSFD